MNNSSQEEPYTITLNEFETLDSKSLGAFTLSSDTWVNLTPTSIPALTSADIITLTGTPYGSGSVTIGNLETFDIHGSFTGSNNYWVKEDFDGRFPDYERVQKMCKEYPGLEIAYRKFKEVYKMVKEDYDGKEREKRGHK
jgi:hypothetical protein